MRSVLGLRRPVSALSEPLSRLNPWTARQDLQVSGIQKHYNFKKNNAFFRFVFHTSAPRTNRVAKSESSKVKQGSIFSRSACSDLLMKVDRGVAHARFHRLLRTLRHGSAANTHARARGSCTASRCIRRTGSDRKKTKQLEARCGFRRV